MSDTLHDSRASTPAAAAATLAMTQEDLDSAGTDVPGVAASRSQQRRPSGVNGCDEEAIAASTIESHDAMREHNPLMLDDEARVGLPQKTVAVDETTQRTKQAVEGKPAGSASDGGESAAETHVEPEPTAPTHFDNKLQDQTNYLPVRQILVVFGAMQLAVLLSFLDQTIVSTALPNISAYFNSGRSSSWVASAYLLTSTAFQPIWGRFSDIFGRKATLQVCLMVFTVGSLACALAKSMTQLIIFRALQGAGGGGLLTLVLIIVSDVVTLKERGKYQGLTEITIVIANGSGPIIGGVLSQKVSWRWCFWLSLPIAAVALVIVQIFLPLKAVKGDIKTKLKQIDYGGALLTIGACCLVLLPLNWGGVSFPWLSATVLGCLFGGLATLVIFIIYEWKVPKIPIVPMFIFKIRTASAVFFNTTISGATILCQLFYIPQFLQIGRGDSAIRSGVLILPLLVTTTFAVFICGQLIARTGQYKPVIMLGYAIWCLGLGLLSTLSEKSSTARLVGYLVLTGAGQGQTLQSSLVAVQAAVQRSEMSVATATRNFLRSFGGTLSLAFAATIINNTLKRNLIPQGFSEALVKQIIDSPTEIWHATTIEGQALFALPQAQKTEIIHAYVKGFRVLFIVFACLQCLNFIVATTFIERLSLVREDEKALKERGKQLLEEKKRKRMAKKGGKDLEDGGVESSQKAQ